MTAEPGARFRPAAKTFRITFDEDHDLHGLWIRTRSVPIDTVLRVLRAAGSGAGKRAATIEDVESVESLFVNFGGALAEWNLDHPATGDPVPATEEGVRTLDLDLVTTLAMEWVQAVMGAAAPLGANSKSGAPALVAGIPMDRLGSSRPSSSKRRSS